MRNDDPEHWCLFYVLPWPQQPSVCCCGSDEFDWPLSEGRLSSKSMQAETKLNFLVSVRKEMTKPKWVPIVPSTCIRTWPGSPTHVHSNCPLKLTLGSRQPLCACVSVHSNHKSGWRTVQFFENLSFLPEPKSPERKAPTARTRPPCWRTAFAADSVQVLRSPSSRLDAAGWVVSGCER